MLLNVLDFPTPEDAINAARDGDRVYFPAAYGPYTAPASGYRIRRNIEIFGDDAGPAGHRLPSTPALPSVRPLDPEDRQSDTKEPVNACNASPCS